MKNIEIDFEVYKHLTFMRENEQMTYNDVIRKLLNLPKLLETETKLPCNNGRAYESLFNNIIVADGWTSKGIFFPNGTIFRANHKGIEYEAEIHSGKLMYRFNYYLRSLIGQVDGQQQLTQDNIDDIKSLSAAASLITGNNVNGWRFWEVKRPQDSEWRKASELLVKPEDGE